MNAIRSAAWLSVLALLALDPAARAAEPAAAVTATVELDTPLPNVPGKSLRVVRVEYAPGASSPAHVHAPSAFIHARVLKGAIRSAVNDAAPRVYREGEAFQERPGDRHSVSENASRTEPAVLLATFVVDTAEVQLTTPR